MLRQIMIYSVSAQVFCSFALAQETESIGGKAVGAGELTVVKDRGAAEAPIRLETIDVFGLRSASGKEITSAVTVLDSEDLAVRLSPNPADQLRAIPGVGVSRSGSVGGLTQIRVRGAEANHTLVLVNGIEVSDPTTGETDFGLLSGLNTNRIEVLRGEASAIYGSDAVGGVVSLETGGANGLTGAAELGTQETYRGHLSYGGESNSYGFGGTVGGFSTAGVDTSGLGGEDDGSDSYSALVHGYHDLGSNWAVKGLATYRRSYVETDPDLDFDGRLDNADRITSSEQVMVGAALSGQTGRVGHQFRANFNTVSRENEADGTRTDETTGERFKLSWSPSIAWGTQSLTALIDFESENYARVAEASFFGNPNQSQSFDSYGIAAEYRASFGELDISASARHDNNDGRFDDANTYRIGTGYSFPQIDGRVRGSIGTGVKNPTFTELFGFFPGQFVGNTELTPEESQGWDIGWDQSFGQIEYSVTYFSAELEDEIYTAFNPDFTSTALNRTMQSDRRGMEFGARWWISETFELSGQATFIESENDSGEDEIRVPSSTVSLGLNWQPSRNGMRMGLALDYVGEQDDFDFGAFPARRVDLDSYTLVSAIAEYPLSDRVSVTIRGENLLDRDVVDVFGFNSPGAAAFIGLRLR